MLKHLYFENTLYLEKTKQQDDTILNVIASAPATPHSVPATQTTLISTTSRPIAVHPLRPPVQLPNSTPTPVPQSTLPVPTTLEPIITTTSRVFTVKPLGPPFLLPVIISTTIKSSVSTNTEVSTTDIAFTTEPSSTKSSEKFPTNIPFIMPTVAPAYENTNDDLNIEPSSMPDNETTFEPNRTDTTIKPVDEKKAIPLVNYDKMGMNGNYTKFISTVRSKMGALNVVCKQVSYSIFTVHFLIYINVNYIYMIYLQIHTEFEKLTRNFCRSARYANHFSDQFTELKAYNNPMSNQTNLCQLVMDKYSTCRHYKDFL